MSIFPSALDSPASPEVAYKLSATRVSAGRAWLFSTLLPGSGQLYCDATTRGVAILFCYIVAIAVIIFAQGDVRWGAVRVAIMFYAFATYDAYETAREYNIGIDATAPNNPRVAAFLNLTTNGFGYVYLSHPYGWGAFVLMLIVGRILFKAFPLGGELLVGILAIHVWKIAEHKRSEVYPKEGRPAAIDTRLPRAVPALYASAFLAWYYALVIVGQVVLLTR